MLQKLTARNRKSDKNTLFLPLSLKKMRALCGENYLFFTAIHRNSYIIFQSNLDPGNEREKKVEL